MLTLYFSGTGNSKYAAELFAASMGGECHSIEEEPSIFPHCWGSRIPLRLSTPCIYHAYQGSWLNSLGRTAQTYVGKSW